ncbi:hypothetical protein DET49_1119 [Salegentibacter sp. 24]|jgi:hypothetical protein|nr:hypothetical protein DET49_1119 [Salegentibacter sp. 24]
MILNHINVRSIVGISDEAMPYLQCVMFYTINQMHYY